MITDERLHIKQFVLTEIMKVIRTCLQLNLQNSNATARRDWISWLGFLPRSRDPVSFYSYKLPRKNVLILGFPGKTFPILGFLGKSIIIFINLKLRIIQCFLGGAQWLNVSIHILTPWSSIAPKSKLCGMSMRVCVCITLRVRRVVRVLYTTTTYLVGTKNIAVGWQRG